eukprot:SAG31_NODE_4804_length_2947_cov_1.739466_3_plen_89_part_00
MALNRVGQSWATARRGTRASWRTARTRSTTTCRRRGADEGLPSFSLRRSILYGESISEEQIVVTNDRAPSYAQADDEALSLAKMRLAL